MHHQNDSLAAGTLSGAGRARRSLLSRAAELLPCGFEGEVVERKDERKKRPSGPTSPPTLVFDRRPLEPSIQMYSARTCPRWSRFKYFKSYRVSRQRAVHCSWNARCLHWPCWRRLWIPPGVVVSKSHMPWVPFRGAHHDCKLDSAMTEI
jgi:hypothetical protein